MGESFGYIRVSTKEQNLDRQLEAVLPYVTMNDDGEPRIYQDKASGKDMEREGFKKMLEAMRKGDTLYVKSIDRLGRNKQHIKEYLELFKKKGVRVKVLDLPTTMIDIPAEQEGIIDMINNILIEVFTTLAQQERETILKRQSEGIAVAKKQGKHLGRPVMELPDEWEKLYRDWKTGKIKAVEFMKLVDMKKPTFYKKVKEYEATL